MSMIHVPIALYALGIASLLLSVFWRPVVGLYYLIPLIPLQTTRYTLNDLPLGHSVVGLTLLAVAIGVLRSRRSPLPMTPWTVLIGIYVVFTFFSLCLGSAYLGAPFPLPGDERFAVWQDYMTMPALLLLVTATQPDRRQVKIIIGLMCISALLMNRSFYNIVSSRDFSMFSNDLREAGQMGYANPNGLAAFEAQFAIFLMALACFSRWRMKLAFYGMALLSALCLMYTLSRGGYIAFLAGIAFLGLVRQRILLALLVVFGLTWAAIVPGAVRDRVNMTYDSETESLDHSSETRVVLWEDALHVFNSSGVVLGTGFDTYAYMHRIGTYADTHNIFLKTLVETGAAGLALLLWLLGKTFLTGYRAFRRMRDPLYAALGLGLAGWVVCAFAANFFGDRWTFLQVNGFMWVIAGLLANGIAVERRETEAQAEANETPERGEAMEAVPEGAAAV